MSNIKKMNVASFRVLNTLLCLFNKDLTMPELIENLNKRGFGPYNNFVVSKYINTCKSCGVDIQKIGQKYKIYNFPIGGGLSASDGELILLLKYCSETFKSKNIHKIIDGLFEKLHLNFYRPNNGLASSANNRIVRLFERACASEKNVDVVFNDKTIDSLNAKAIFVKDGKIFFKMEQNGEIVDFDPDNILDIQALEERPGSIFFANTVIFELYGRLAKSYQLRENEQIIHFKSDGSIVVSNKYEDKETLLHRLMRYDSSCKILRPREYVRDMKKMINKTLENYGE